MKKIPLILSAAFICILSMSSSTQNIAENEKVTICHIPPGNPENSFEITVDLHALPAHLAHGDLLGGCNIID